MIKTSKTIDVTPTWESLVPVLAHITPTWESLVPVLAHIIRHAKTNGAVDDITKELKKMAQAADRWNAYCKENT